MSSDSKPEEEPFSRPLSSNFEGSAGCLAATLVVFEGLTVWAWLWKAWPWWIVVVGLAPFLVGCLSLLVMPARAFCPKCGDIIDRERVLSRTILWCEKCKEYYQVRGDVTTSLDPDYVDEKYVFAVSLFGLSDIPLEDWNWPQVCPTCGAVATDHSVIEGEMLVGASSSFIRTRQVSLCTPRCANPRHRGVILSNSPATRLLFCSRAYWKEFIRMNQRFAGPCAPR